MAKIAVSLPDAVLAAIEQARRKTGESRSEFLRRAVESTMRHERRRQLIDRYIEGYKRMPETVDDTLYSEELSDLIAQENPWEPGAAPLAAR